MSSLVSIIIPCYRQGHFLGEAIDSALSQTYQEREIIVVNDGSDDNTEEVAKSYGDKIHYVKKANGGLPSARNAGIDIAQGKYLHFLDSDDLLLPHALSSLLEVMEEREDRIALVGYRFFKKDAFEEGQQESLPPERMEPFPLLLNKNFGPPNMLLTSRKMILAAGKFRESLRSCEDWDMWLRLVFQGAEIRGKRTVAVCYRRHDASMTQNFPRMLDARSRVLRYTHELFLKTPALLSAYGTDLLKVENRVLRRWIATEYDDSWIPEIFSMIKELEQRGHLLSRSTLRLLIDKAFGIWSERAAVEFFRCFKPEKYQSYKQGCN